MKKNKKPEEKKNPLHIEHSIWSNVRFISGQIWKHNRVTWLFFVIAIICAPFLQYVWAFITKAVIDIITAEGDQWDLLNVVLICGGIQLAAQLIGGYKDANIWWRIIFIRAKMMVMQNHRIMTIRYENLENPDVLDMYYKSQKACDGNANGVGGVMYDILNLCETALVVAVGVVILGTFNPFVMVLLAIVAVLRFVIDNGGNKYSKKKVWDPLASFWRKQYYMNRISTDFSFAKDVRMFNLRDFLMNKYSELNEIYYSKRRFIVKIFTILSSLNTVLVVIYQVLIYLWLFQEVLNGSMTIGEFTLYLAASQTLFQYIGNLLSISISLFQNSRKVDDFRSFIEFEAGDTGGKKVPHSDKWEFEFKNVSFKYPRAEKFALRNVSITLKTGESLAVVGLNGAGKSTFIKLLMRLYEPCEGEILLNGVNIAEYDLDEYYTIFSPVFQDVELYAFPLAENVSMKTPEKTDKDIAEKSLCRAGFGEKLKTLDKGLETEVLKILYDDGVDFSGGEKQKLALARALYKNAPVVVLDEPTAALDALAEYKLYQDFDKLIEGKTSVYISHRLSSTRFCDHVAIFNDGAIIEYGTHESLLAMGGKYAEMFKIQAQYYVENNAGIREEAQQNV